MMTPRHMSAVMEIENDSYQHPCLEKVFRPGAPNRIRMVAKLPGSLVGGGRVIGYMVYELDKLRIDILNFTVARDMRRLGVGTYMVQTLVEIVERKTNARTHISVEVDEYDLPAQLFWRVCGFRAVSIIHDAFEKTSGDVYVIEYRQDQARQMPIFGGVNRIKRSDEGGSFWERPTWSNRIASFYRP